jgi:hypothetical protein
LGVQGVGGHDRTGHVETIDQGGEQADLVRVRRHADLAEDHPGGVVERGQQEPS